MDGTLGRQKGIGIKRKGSEVRLLGFESTSTVTCCVTLGKLLNLSELELSHLLNGGNHTRYFKRLLGLNEMIYLKYLASCLEYATASGSMR